jgi:PBP1b-binding outer membrane lipoprotein LpoB
MKTGLLSIITCAVLLCLFFCGCTNSEKTSNQHSTNEAEKVASSASTITDNGDLPAETKASATESEVATPAEQIVSSVAQNLKPAEK